MIGMNYLQLIAQEIDDTANHATLSLNCLSFDYQKFPPLFSWAAHMKFLPFLSPIFKTIRATTTRYLPIGAWHATRFRNETILARRTTSAETNCTVYPRTMVKTNGTEVKTTSVPLALEQNT